MSNEERISNAKVHIRTANKMISMQAYAIAVEALKAAARELEAVQGSPERFGRP